MASPEDIYFFRGEPVSTPWSGKVVVKQVLTSFNTSDCRFLGVRAENQDRQDLDWLSEDCLLWVWENGSGLQTSCSARRSLYSDATEIAQNVERIVGYYECANGDSYVGVKWKDTAFPTWELEEEIPFCAHMIHSYIEEEKLSIHWSFDGNKFDNIEALTEGC